MTPPVLDGSSGADRLVASDGMAILAAVAEVARTHLEWKGELLPEQRLVESLALDSLRRLTLVVEVENRFRIRLDDESEAGIETVADLVRVIRAKLGGGSE